MAPGWRCSTHSRGGRARGGFLLPGVRPAGALLLAEQFGLDDHVYPLTHRWLQLRQHAQEARLRTRGHEVPAATRIGDQRGQDCSYALWLLPGRQYLDGPGLPLEHHLGSRPVAQAFPRLNPCLLGTQGPRRMPGCLRMLRFDPPPGLITGIQVIEGGEQQRPKGVLQPGQPLPFPCEPDPAGFVHHQGHRLRHPSPSPAFQAMTRGPLSHPPVLLKAYSETM